MQSKDEGVLLIIGGNEDKTGECHILRTFIERAGGREAKIAVITTATQLPEEVGIEYKMVFEWLGAELVDIVHIADRAKGILINI